MRTPALGEGAAEDARPFVEIEDRMRVETIGALDLKGLEMWVGTYRMMGFGAC